VSVWAVVVAAGGGSRFGAAKQFAALRDGTRVVDHAVATARAAVGNVVVVVPDGDPWVPTDDALVVVGGATRSASVRAGLARVPDDAQIVVVHDAARPLASRALFDAVVAAVRAGADAAVPTLPVVDTVKQVASGRVVATVPRDGLCIAQTPQAFRADVLRRAHATGAAGTDDAALVEAAGGTVVTVPGEPGNLKITVAADLDLARRLVETR
jgi:2-C-methyl-D-erythritol 4-phosphate cytidylyltransferase